MEYYNANEKASNNAAIDEERNKKKLYERKCEEVIHRKRNVF